MVINYKNQGRDSTLEPAYIKNYVSSEPEPEDIEWLKQEIQKLKTRVTELETEKILIIEQINNLEENQEELQNQITNLNEIINNLQLQINSLEAALAELDGHRPIELSFIDALEPYNSQEGVG